MNGAYTFVDHFLSTFTHVIDSGFGLLSADVAYLTSTLIVLDLTLAGLMWAMGKGGDEVLANLINKVLVIGTFALIINNYKFLTETIFETFAALGLKAAASPLSQAALFQPSTVAVTGIKAAAPLLVYVQNIQGPIDSFVNLPDTLICLVAWVLVVLAFFIMAVQLIVVVIEFKLVTLAGFILVPFGIWRRTAFMSDRLFAYVINSGIKVMVLAVILSIGTPLFTDLLSLNTPENPTLETAFALVLGSLAMFGLALFGPGFAAGLVHGGPQFGAGSAAAVVAAPFAIGAGAVGALRSAGHAAQTVGTGAATAAGAAAAGANLVAAGANVAAAGSNAATASGAVTGAVKGLGQLGAAAMKTTAANAAAPFTAAFKAGAGLVGASAAAAAPDSSAAPAWATQTPGGAASQVAMAAATAANVLRAGDAPMGGGGPDLSTDE